ncbi:hypothetical protein BraRD5C2_38630 [Bradyrhizobium sp. RD5-C2]|nr:hypothetical protein BraRD5C2_38630 [Bradyrhizobium sp. RD5-C2]
MPNGGNPVRFWERHALIVRYRDETGLRKPLYNVDQARKVQPPMHRCQKGDTETAKQRKRKPIDMRVDHVEISRMLGDGFQQHRASRVGIDALTPQAESARPYRMELASRPGIAARKERNVVSELDQFVHQPGRDPLGASVELGRNALGKGGQLSYAHECP